MSQFEHSHSYIINKHQRVADKTKSTRICNFLWKVHFISPSELNGPFGSTEKILSIFVKASASKFASFNWNGFVSYWICEGKLYSFSDASKFSIWRSPISLNLYKSLSWWRSYGQLSNSTSTLLGHVEIAICLSVHFFCSFILKARTDSTAVVNGVFDEKVLANWGTYRGYPTPSVESKTITSWRSPTLESFLYKTWNCSNVEDASTGFCTHACCQLWCNTLSK